MNLAKCDRCKKVIQKPLEKGSTSVHTYGIQWGAVDLCSRCSPAFLRFFNKYAKVKEGKDFKNRRKSGPKR